MQPLFQQTLRVYNLVMTPFTESTIEQAALEWLQSLGYDYAFGPEIAPDGGRPERGDYQQTLLLGRLREALARINPDLPTTAREEALQRVLRPDQPGGSRLGHVGFLR